MFAIAMFTGCVASIVAPMIGIYVRPGRLQFRPFKSWNLKFQNFSTNGKIIFSVISSVGLAKTRAIGKYWKMSLVPQSLL